MVKRNSRLSRRIPKEASRTQVVPVESTAIRVLPQAIEIRNSALFGEADTPLIRDFLARSFGVSEVDAIEIDSRRGTGRVHYGRDLEGPAILRKLKASLVAGKNAIPSLETGSLYLTQSKPAKIRVTRFGDVLSTWTISSQSRNRIRLTHPLLKNRRDVAYRLEEELTAIFGVRSFRTNIFSASVTIHFRPGSLTAERLVRHLEGAWPRLVSGLEAPPSPKRFLAATSMLTLAFTGQFLVPSLLPVALVAVTIYGFPNLIGALKLIRRGHVALPVLYSGTLTFTLLSGLPFSATLMASMMQWWPRWGYRTITTSQRRIFANLRQRITWARLATNGDTEVEIDIDQLKAGDVIRVDEDEVVPVDGIIVSGLAAIDEEALTGRAGAFDKAPGDPVYAATFVRAGQIHVRVTHKGADSRAGHIAEQLPHGYFRELPSSGEAEDVANGLVAPTLALAGLNLLVTGNVQPSQSALRPDYATSPRLAAQFAALFGLSDGLRRGLLFRDAAALDRLPSTDIYIFDDSPALERRRIAVGDVLPAPGSSTEEVLSYAASAFPSFQNERARSLMERCLRLGLPLLEISERRREAGVIEYRDADGKWIQVAAPAWIAAQKNIRVPKTLAAAIKKSPSAWEDASSRTPHAEPQLRPLWVLRDGNLLGVVTFHRAGELEVTEVIGTLRARNPNARFLLISKSSQQQINTVAAEIGIASAFGGLTPSDKARIVRDFGKRTMWIGNGADPAAADCIAASTVSVSVAGAPTLTTDQANVVILQPTTRGLVSVRRLGRRHRKFLKESYRAVFAANLLCLGGAFFAEFTTLTVALVSNFGTGGVFAAHRKQLNDLATRMEKKMGTRLSAEIEDQEEEEDGTPDELESFEEYGGHPHDREPDREVAV